VGELISILSHKEKFMKKGKGYIVQHISHKNAEKKKNFLKDKNTEVSFKSLSKTKVVKRVDIDKTSHHSSSNLKITKNLSFKTYKN